uniref:F-box domain-containing protein n=1 Tax=Mycena chlorophos TaxID=658473 RepID=A0ABQ0M7P4_MYCCL|nr:predicted protein [Mycena chlorophos]
MRSAGLCSCLPEVIGRRSEDRTLSTRAWIRVPDATSESPDDLGPALATSPPTLLFSIRPPSSFVVFWADLEETLQRARVDTIYWEWESLGEDESRDARALPGLIHTTTTTSPTVSTSTRTHKCHIHTLPPSTSPMDDQRNKPLVKTPNLGDLSDAVLGCIVTELPWSTILVVSELSRRLRMVLSPTLFRTVRWAPLRRGFPPEALWPHIEILILAGDMHLIRTESGHETKMDLDYEAITADAKAGIPRLPALHTLELTLTVQGGLWQELLDVISHVPTLTRLRLHANWFSGRPGRPTAVELQSMHTNLQYVEYPFSFPQPMERRHPQMLEVEGYNLRRLLEGCRLTLEKVVLPGELLFRAMEYSQFWSSLQELSINGFWPLEEPAASPSNGDTRSQLLRVLEALPRLRVAAFNIYAATSDPRTMTLIVGPNSGLPCFPEAFLRHLEIFQIPSLRPFERILEYLPRSLQTLSMPQRSRNFSSTLHQPILPASVLRKLLARADFPDLEVLELQYGVGDGEQVDAEHDLLSLLPIKFPQLRRLTVVRIWDHTAMDLWELWDPTPAYKTLLSRLPNLHSFRFNPDDPQRCGLSAFWDYDPPYVAYIERLRTLGEALVRDCPWLVEISLYREFRDDPRWFWEYWEVVTGSEGVRLEGVERAGKGNLDCVRSRREVGIVVDTLERAPYPTENQMLTSVRESVYGPRDAATQLILDADSRPTELLEKDLTLAPANVPRNGPTP